MMDNGNVCLMGKYHNILHVGLKLSYIWQLKDNGTVATLLDHVYLCEKTFERLFAGALFGSKASYLIAGWKSDFDQRDENIRAVVFFLDHATNAGLEYLHGSDNKVTRFIEIPLESCCKLNAVKLSVQLGLPDRLHIFLRYGALLEPESGDSESVVENVLEMLYENTGKYPYNIVACLSVILRTIPSVPAKLNYCSRETDWNIQRGYIMEKYPLLIEHCILPLDRCGFLPPKLMHLCRCAVRYRLWENYQLPNGIRALPVPENLQRYLDIMED